MLCGFFSYARTGKNEKVRSGRWQSLIWPRAMSDGEHQTSRRNLLKFCCNPPYRPLLSRCRLLPTMRRSLEPLPPPAQAKTAHHPIPPLPKHTAHTRPLLFYRFSTILNSPNPRLSTSLTVTGFLFLFVAFVLDISVYLQLTSTLAAPLQAISRHSTQLYHSLTMASNRPPSKKELGNSGWTLIHSIAANYPQKPTSNEQRYAKAFLRSIGKLYPCKRCRQHFDRYLSTTPPDLSSRDHFMLWACGAHNAVNRRSGKPEFPCQMRNLEQRWGDCGCKVKQK